MPRCSKCGKQITAAPMVCGECQQGWIPIGERLPDENGFYIVYMDGDIIDQDEFFVTACGFYNGKWDDGEISHWMPFPEPPEAWGV